MAQQVPRDMQFMRRVNEWQQYLERHHDGIMLLQETACMRRPILSIGYIITWYSVWTFFTLSSLSIMTKLVIAATTVALANAMLLRLSARISSDAIVGALHTRVPLVARQPWQLPLRSVQELASCLAHIQQWKEDTAAHVAAVQRSRLGTFTFVLVMASLFLAWAFSIFSDTTHLFFLVTACVLTPFVERIYAVHRHWPVVRAVAYNIFGRLANITAFILARLPARGIVYDPNANVEPIQVHGKGKASKSPSSSSSTSSTTATAATSSTVSHANVTERRRAARSAASRKPDTEPAAAAAAAGGSKGAAPATDTAVRAKSGTAAARLGLLASVGLSSMQQSKGAEQDKAGDQAEHGDDEAEQSGLTLEEELRRAQMPDEEPKTKATQPKASSLPKPSSHAPFYPTWKKSDNSPTTTTATATAKATTAKATTAATTTAARASSSSSSAGAAEASKTKVQPYTTAAPAASARQKGQRGESKLPFGKTTAKATTTAATGAGAGSGRASSGISSMFGSRLFGIGTKPSGGDTAADKGKTGDATTTKTETTKRQPTAAAVAAGSTNTTKVNPAATCSEVVLGGAAKQGKQGPDKADNGAGSGKPKGLKPFSGGRLGSSIPPFKDYDFGMLGGSKSVAGKESTAGKDTDDKTPTAADANKNDGAGRRPLSSSPPAFALGKERDSKPPFTFDFGGRRAGSSSTPAAATSTATAKPEPTATTSATTAAAGKNASTGYVASKFSFGHKASAAPPVTTAGTTARATGKEKKSGGTTDERKPSPFTFSTTGSEGSEGSEGATGSKESTGKNDPSLSALLGKLDDDDDGNNNDGGGSSKDDDKVVASTPRAPPGTGGGNLIDISMGFNDAMKDTDDIPDPLSDLFMKEDADEDAFVVTSPSRGTRPEQVKQGNEDESYDPEDNTSSY